MTTNENVYQGNSNSWSILPKHVFRTPEIYQLIYNSLFELSSFEKLLQSRQRFILKDILFEGHSILRNSHSADNPHIILRKNLPTTIPAEVADAYEGGMPTMSACSIPVMQRLAHMGFYSKLSAEIPENLLESPGLGTVH